jgi:hypothetical protein
VDTISLDCTSCAVRVELPHGAPELVDRARRFFAEHADCEATLDLDSGRLVGWALRPTPPPPGVWG